MKPKKIAPKISTLQAKADILMSEYIRRKWSDQDGLVTCVSCGKRLHWKEADCGHFVPKSRGASIRYVEENCAPECPGCNRFNEGHLIGYTRWMIEYYGPEKIDELQNEARKVLSPSQKSAIVEEAIAYYRDRLQQLEKDNGAV